MCTSQFLVSISKCVHLNQSVARWRTPGNIILFTANSSRSLRLGGRERFVLRLMFWGRREDIVTNVSHPEPCSSPSLNRLLQDRKNLVLSCKMFLGRYHHGNVITWLSPWQPVPPPPTLFRPNCVNMKCFLVSLQRVTKRVLTFELWSLQVTLVCLKSQWKAALTKAIRKDVEDFHTVMRLLPCAYFVGRSVMGWYKLWEWVRNGGGWVGRLCTVCILDALFGTFCMWIYDVASLEIGRFLSQSRCGSPV